MLKKSILFIGSCFFLFLSCDSRMNEKLFFVTDYLNSKETTGKVKFSNSSLNIKIIIPYEELLSYKWLKLSARNMIYDLKEVTNDINVINIKFESEYRDTVENELLKYSKSQIISTLEDYEKNPLKVKYSKFLIDSIGLRTFSNLERFFLQTTYGTKNTDYRKPGFTILIDLIATNCWNRKSEEIINKFTAFRDVILENFDELEKGYFKGTSKEEIFKLNFFIENCIAATVDSTPAEEEEEE